MEGLGRYALMRFFSLIPILLGALLITFILTRVVPGNPIDRATGGYLTEEQRQSLKEEARLDRPIALQFIAYLGDVVQGDLGTSYSTSQKVADDLRSRMGTSTELVFLAFILALMVALPLGVVAAMWRDTWVDHVARFISVAGLSIPVFWLGMQFLWLFWYKLGWLPGPLAAGNVNSGSSSLFIVPLLRGDFQIAVKGFQALVLPMVALAVIVVAPIARMTRATMVDVLQSEYIRTARSLGFSTTTILFHHAMKNAAVPVLGITAAVFGYAIGSQVLVEIIFNWPGIGAYSYKAVINSDFPAIQGFVLVITTMYVVIYFLVDIANAVLDPRLRSAVGS